jgi:hypothetical protein
MVTTAHVATGSLIFAISVTLALRSLRLVRGEARPAAAKNIALGVAA